MVPSERLTGEYGSKQINKIGTTTLGGSFSDKIGFVSFIPNTETVISAIYDEYGNDIIDKITDDKTKEFIPGAVYTAAVNGYFTKVSLVSGSMLIYFGRE